MPIATMAAFPAPDLYLVPLSRKIIHVDMDAFFAAVEQRDNPALRGQPVIVGGDPQGRGVVAACSYEARAFGVHSAMPCAKAKRLCPEAVFIRPRMARYQEVSRAIMALFHRVTDLVEPLSVDEAFLDVTENHLGEISATRLAELLRRLIVAETGLTASAGVSYNKFLAKIASGHQKPNGLTVVPPEKAAAFLAALAIGKFYGVGKVTEKKMHALGIRTGKDLLGLSKERLTQLFGKSGPFFYDMVRGRDQRPVSAIRVRKSVGAETTLAEDTADYAQIKAILEDLVARVARYLAAKETGGRTLSLKVRYHDFTTITRACTQPQGFFTAPEMLACLPRLLATTEAGRQKIRLLGVTVSNLCSQRPEQTGRRQLPLPFPQVTPLTPKAPSFDLTPTPCGDKRSRF